MEKRAMGGKVKIRDVSPKKLGLAVDKGRLMRKGEGAHPGRSR